jgi:hypothetical protein
MKKHFYSHIIEIDSIFITLDLMDMKTEEREDLVTIVESSVHHVVIDTVLTQLSEEDKKMFLSHLVADKHDDIWTLLKEKTRSIEKKILKAVENFKKDIHKDIAKAKSKKK